MDSPGSDDERLQQEREAALSKKVKIMIIMLSLVLMILLLPLASNHGLPLLRPMGTSLLQRLWDAMRFIAMTAAISVGIISTSNSQKNDKAFDASSPYRSSPSFRRPSVTPIASSSREAFIPNMPQFSNNSTDRSGSLSSYAEQMPEGEDGDGEFIWKGIQMGINKQKSKGKEVMNNVPSSGRAYGDMFFDSAEDTSTSVQSQSNLYFEGEDPEGSKHKPLKLSMVNSRRQWSAGDAWFLASRIDEEVEEDSVANTEHGLSSNRSRLGESSISRTDLLKTSLASQGKEGTNKDQNKGLDKGHTNVYKTMTDDNYADFRMRKTAVSRLAQESEIKSHRRSSSVDRRRPLYIYDQKTPEQPGLKQILTEMSKERASKSKMYDSETSGSLIPNAVSSTSSYKQSMKGNVQHNRPSVVSTVKLPLDSTVVEKHVDAKILGANHKQKEAVNMVSNESFQRKLDAAKMGSIHSKPTIVSETSPTSQEILHRQGNTETAFNDNMQHQEAYGTQRRSRPYGEAAKVDNTQQNVRTEGDPKARMGSPYKQTDGKIAAQALNATSDQLLQMQNDHKLPSESAMLRHRVSGSSRLLKQSSQHSRSALNLEQLGQADQSPQQTRPPVRSSERGRRSFSYDFGDGFNQDWLLELEPPPPPVLLVGSSTEEGQQLSNSINNFEVRGIDKSSLVQSLVPWRSSAPIDISAYPRAASPPEALSSQATGPSPGEVNRRADEFISNFTTRLIKQRQESLERQKIDQSKARISKYFG